MSMIFVNPYSKIGMRIKKAFIIGNVFATNSSQKVKSSPSCCFFICRIICISPDLTSHLSGNLYGDKGYLSEILTNTLREKGITLITHVRKNMKNKFISCFDKAVLRKRFIIETVNDVLKNVCQIEHTRHRSIANFMNNLLSGLIAYTFLENKPKCSIHEI